MSAMIGKLVRGKRYVHRSAVKLLPPILCRRVEAGQAKLPPRWIWTLVRIDPDRVVFLRTTDWSQPHPALTHSFDAKTGREREYRSDRPVYHRQEDFMAPDDPLAIRFAKLTAQEQASGLLGRSDIGREQGWAKALADAGVQIHGRRLVEKTNHGSMVRWMEPMIIPIYHGENDQYEYWESDTKRTAAGTVYQIRRWLGSVDTTWHGFTVDALRVSGGKRNLTLNVGHGTLDEVIAAFSRKHNVELRLDHGRCWILSPGRKNAKLVQTILGSSNNDLPFHLLSRGGDDLHIDFDWKLYDDRGRFVVDGRFTTRPPKPDSEPSRWSGFPEDSPFVWKGLKAVLRQHGAEAGWVIVIEGKGWLYDGDPHTHEVAYRVGDLRRKHVWLEHILVPPMISTIVGYDLDWKGSRAIVEPDWGVAARRRSKAKRKPPKLDSLEVVSAATYASRTRHRGKLGPAWDEIQDIVDGVKRGEAIAVERAAAMVAYLPGLEGSGWVVVPVPRSSEDRPSLLPLAKAVAKLRRWKALAALRRTHDVPSSRVLRGMGRGGVSLAVHHGTIAQVRSIPSDAPVLLVDEVVTEGTTLLACAQVLRDGGHRGPIMGLTVASVPSKLNPKIDPFTPVTRVVRKSW